ncbi:formate dehydrogenase family accessory protein FdhD [Gilliamella sp. Choc4-2]|jgi:FdhD protein|uniref:formate dehydrogenase accessory sulfurtransferase FdhD n=1 Tax=unclassified Gilliamella TaxID=2685620 RepID=UPI0004DD27C7|nr:formate dehydrogenase accessory sulfurtransferase FdhD [Gilliamella apicola]KFA59392.1 Formate dehydrogenase chain D [Gilliamella apicola]OCG32009.1 formate dehydrogenase family accessory protein FdhD [Gilliamella apicola]OCG45082.1 formate dehydrogenase family accessory protein FdhD [Gilliamella apicola]OCG54654.1 formate dehydrogenase family accessory protein FdhD [Gilliamella apicola]OCG65115.1 formate dehydrogenase family accessory protein FdhD [Gilliamella apicola]
MTIGIKKISVKKFKDRDFFNSQEDIIAIEKPVALIYNGISHVVMMATPKDLNYFAIGFSLTEKIIQNVNEIYSIDIMDTSKGIEVHIELSSRRFSELKQKRRNLTGRTGCGICGSEQIDQVCQILPSIPINDHIVLSDFNHSLSHLRKVQLVGNKTGCTHAAVWLDLKGNFLAGFEDVGRHVALDKLLGFRAIKLQKNLEYQHGVVLVSSRASYEMVQKTASCGIEIILAVSAATSMAVDMAKQTNITLIGFFRGDKGVIYTGTDRIN